MSLPVIDIAQMRVWERMTWESGKTEAEVIQRAGQAVGVRAQQLTEPGERVLILAGKGHNGDDARQAGRHLTGRDVKLMSVTDPQADLATLSSLLALRPALIIDGLFGIGLSRPLDDHWSRLIEQINQSKSPILAVDVPSGLNGDNGQVQGTAIQATVTLTLAAPKKGLLLPSAWPYVGRLEVVPDIGLVPCPHQGEVNWTMPDDFRDYPPRRPVASHKGSFGHLLIIAGSLGYHGASVLAARGALSARPGLVSLRPQPEAYLPVAAQLQSAMVAPWKDQLEPPESTSGFLIGPGLAAPGLPAKLKTSVRQLWKSSPLPVVVDASALDWLPSGNISTKAIRLITPHPGEAARMLKSTVAQVQSDRPAALRELSRRFGDCWVVLKGHQSVVGRATGDLFVNSSGNPYLAQGGSGDVLSGYLAGLLAQPPLQEDPVLTIRFGVWRHGAAADVLQAARANWILEHLVEALGRIKNTLAL
ncbi:MAG: NAD(P)H-hydrate dehydratase [Candidatus Omnitrophica bacterium]|nr:NAD(P)H-hydrate dehydratase [Candidatus Omnitrophota bacterium]